MTPDIPDIIEPSNNKLARMPNSRPFSFFNTSRDFFAVKRQSLKLFPPTLFVVHFCTFLAKCLVKAIKDRQGSKE